MLNKKVFVTLVIVVALALGIPAMVAAQAADDQSWSSTIAYANPSDTAGTLQVSFYEEGSSTAINAPQIPLAAHSSGLLIIGSTSGMPASFAGSAVLSSDVPVVATYVQHVSGAGDSYPRPLYTGFNPSDASDKFYIPTFLYEKWDNSTSIGIQNVGATALDADVMLFEPGQSTATVTQTVTIQPQSTELMRGIDFGIAAGFNGSVVIDVDGSGDVVASAIEYSTLFRDAKAFEGFASGSTTVYMPTMTCNAWGGMNTYYAVQNAGTATTTVDVTYYWKDGSVAGTHQFDLGPNSKQSLNSCHYVSAKNQSGSALIESSGQPLLVMGKVAFGGISQTAFVGQATGANKVVGPYVNWSGNGVDLGGWRTYIAVMNVGSSDATNVVANYYNADGTLAKSHVLATAGSPLPQFIKANTNASTAGALDGNGNFGDGGGSVEIVSDQPVVVNVRLGKTTSIDPKYSQFTEDYNGVAVD
jgi:hypothetical protein